MASKIKTTVKAIDRIKLENLDLDQLEILLESTECQYRQLDNDATELLSQSNKMLAEGDLEVLSFARTRKGRIQTELASLHESKIKLQNERHRKIIRKRMIDRLGSQKRLVVLEAFIMFLIACVLG